MKVLIIGGGAAGTTAAMHMRSLSEEVEITIITNEPYTHYSPCGIPYVLSGLLEEMEELIVYPPSLYKLMNIKLHLNQEAESLQNGEVKTKDGNTFHYDTLLLTTGSKPIIPPIFGAETALILKNLDDGKRILSLIKEGAKEALIVGAGPLGVEVCAALLKRGMRVHLIEKCKSVLPSLLDEDMATPLQKRMEEEGVRIYLGESIERIEEGKKKRVYLSGGERIECDFLLFACGTKANAELAKEAGIECGTTGAVKVDEFGETAKEGVFATGECAEGVDFVNGAPTVAKTGSIATLQGKIVAENILGRRRKLPPILFSLLTDVFGFQIAALGTREMEDAVVGRFEGGVKDKFYPQTENIKIKILVQRGSGRILGAQMVGDEVFARALSLQFAMQAGVDVDALSFYQTMYVPSICATFEPLILAAQAARRYA